jgi:formate-nitrite transporter family protein
MKTEQTPDPKRARGKQPNTSGEQFASDTIESNREPITEPEVEQVEERSRPRTPVIYEVVRRLGEEEMVRPLVSLWWSGVAAGLSISFSLLSQAILVLRLPDAQWRPLISSFGYSVGFVMVVLARQQLFTENTITVVLPVMACFTGRNLGRLARMWGIVLGANLVGTLVAASFCTFTPVVDAELRESMLGISRGILAYGSIELFFRGISAGFLIATMVWLIPSAASAQFYVIVLMTYLISVGDFAHIVAGSMEAFMLVVNGDAELWRIVQGFLAPVLLGNIVGGTALFAMISYAQVMKEI